MMLLLITSLILVVVGLLAFGTYNYYIDHIKDFGDKNTSLKQTRKK